MNQNFIKLVTVFLFGHETQIFSSKGYINFDFPNESHKPGKSRIFLIKYIPLYHNESLREDGKVIMFHL